MPLLCMISLFILMQWQLVHINNNEMNVMHVGILIITISTVLNKFFLLQQYNVIFHPTLYQDEKSNFLNLMLSLAERNTAYLWNN